MARAALKSRIQESNLGAVIGAFTGGPQPILLNQEALAEVLEDAVHDVCPLASMGAGSLPSR
eukprot:14631877-Heterocapsa_arctica.AAC.1